MTKEEKLDKLRQLLMSINDSTSALLDLIDEENDEEYLDDRIGMLIEVEDYLRSDTEFHLG